MKPRRARELAKALLPDIDGMLAGETRTLEDRHSAGASALLLATRLFGGVCINIARIADALDDIAYHMTEKTDGNLDGATVRPEQASGTVPLGSEQRPEGLEPHGDQAPR